MHAVLALVGAALLCDVQGLRLNRHSAHSGALEVGSLKQTNQELRCNALDELEVNNQSRCEPYDCVVFQYALKTNEGVGHQQLEAAVLAAGYTMREVMVYGGLAYEQATDTNGKQWGTAGVDYLPSLLPEDIFPLQIRWVIPAPASVVFKATVDSLSVARRLEEDESFAQQFFVDAGAATGCSVDQLKALRNSSWQIWKDSMGNDLGSNPDLLGMAEDRFPVHLEEALGGRW